MKKHFKDFIATIVSITLSKTLVVLFFLLVIFYGVAYYENLMVDRAKESTLRDANLIVNEYNNQIDHVGQIAKVVSALPEVQAKDSAKCNQILHEFYGNDPDLSVVLVADTNGDSFCTSSPTPGISIADRANFQNAIKNGKLSPGGFIIGKITGIPAASYGYPYYDANHQLLGVVGIGLKIDAIQSFAQTLDENMDTQVTMVDYNDTILTSYPQNSAGTVGTKWNSADFGQALSNTDKSVVINDGSQMKLVRSFNRTRLGGVVVIVSSPVKSFFLFAADLLLKFYGYIIAAYFAALILAYLAKITFKIKIKNS